MERNSLIKAVGCIAWSYVFLHLNLNLGTINVLPDWAGYLLLLRALPMLGTAEPSALLLRPLGIVLAVERGIQWVLALLGSQAQLPMLTLVITVLELYFHFQLLTDLGRISAALAYPGQKKLFTLRTLRLLFTTLTCLSLPWTQAQAWIISVTVANLIVVLWICCALFSFRCWLSDLSPQPEEPGQTQE